MNVEKRNRYAKRLTENGIDTLSGELKNKNNTVIGKKDFANYAQTECQFRYCGTAIPFLTVRSTAR